MHSKDARAEGETEQRLYVLRSWREAPFLYRSRARGAGLDRKVTLITKGHVSDEVYEEAKQRFSDEELVNLQTGGRHHQGLDRLAIAFSALPGEYQPRAHKTEGAK
jgi:alkylhydroperoxidase family enzyme